MQNHRIFVTLLLVLVLNVCASAPLRAETVTISDLGVDNAQGAVSVGFSIVVDDIAPLLQALQDGGDYDVLCTARLYKRRGGFWDTFLTEGSYSCTISSKPIARECLVLDKRGSHTFEFASLKTDLNRFWSRLSMPMGSWDLIERGNAYRVEMTFRISRTNIPAWVSKPLFFVNKDLVPEVGYVFDFDF